MTGQPQLGTNPFFSLDATAVDVVDSLGAANTVMQFGTPFAISVTFELAGSAAPWFVSFPGTVFSVLYSFESLTGGSNLVNPGSPVALTPSVLTYDAPATTADITGGLLGVGVYQTTAVVTFPTSPLPFPARPFQDHSVG